MASEVLSDYFNTVRGSKAVMPCISYITKQCFNSTVGFLTTTKLMFSVAFTRLYANTRRNCLLMNFLDIKYHQTFHTLQGAIFWEFAVFLLLII